MVGVQWPGGKARMLKELLPHVNNIPHSLFGDCFGGSGSVTFSKQPSPNDVYNDINNGLYNFFMVLRTRDIELTNALTLTPYSRTEFEACENWTEVDDPVEKARQWFVRSQQSFNILFDNWSYSKISRRQMSKQVSAWLRQVDDRLPLVVERLRQIQVECLDFETFMSKYDSANTLFYLDPPYVPSRRVRKKTYQNEFKKEDHKRLVNRLKDIRGKAILSGYDNEIYDKLGWDKITLGIYTRPMGYSPKGKEYSKMEEILWIKS